MKLLEKTGLSTAILLASTLSVLQNSSLANAKTFKNRTIEKNLYFHQLTSPPTFPKQKNEVDCFNFDKYNSCYKGYKHFLIASHKQKQVQSKLPKLTVFASINK